MSSTSFKRARFPQAGEQVFVVDDPGRAALCEVTRFEGGRLALSGSQPEGFAKKGRVSVGYEAEGLLYVLSGLIVGAHSGLLIETTGAPALVNRRDAPRIPLLALVEIGRVGSAETQPATLMDLSASGARVRSKALHAVGERCRLILHLRSGGTVETEAQVVRCANPIQSTGREICLSFENCVEVGLEVERLRD